MNKVEISELKPVLLLARDIDPNQSSRGWYNFKWCQAIANNFSVTLLTTRVDDESALRNHFPKAEVVFLTQFLSNQRKDDFNRNARLWISSQLQAGRNFAIAHQLTNDVCREPSPLIGLGLPFVLGPLSALSNPLDASSSIAPGMETWRLKQSPLIRGSLRQASAILCSDDYTVEVLRRFGVNTLVPSQEFITPFLPRRACPSLADGRLRLLYDAREQGLEKFEVLIELMTVSSNLSGVSLKLILDSNELEEVRERIAGLEECIELHGAEHNKLDVLYQQSDLVIQLQKPLQNENTEIALGNGLPILRVCHSGADDLIDSSCGFVLAATDHASCVDKIVQTLREILERPFLLTPRRLAARQKANEIFYWKQCGALVSNLYNRVLETQGISDSIALSA